MGETFLSVRFMDAMDYQLLSIAALFLVIVGSAMWLTGRRPDARVRRFISQADWQLEAGEFAAARKLLEKAEGPFSRISDEPERRELRSEIERRLGAIALNADEYDEAERLLTSAIENCDSLLSSRDPSSIEPLGNLAIVQFEQGNDLHADAAFERILRYEPNEYTPELALTSELLRQLAMECLSRDFYRWPEQLLLRSLEHQTDESDPDRRVWTLLNLAQGRFIVMDYSGAREAIEQASLLALNESGFSTFSFLRGHQALLACNWDDAEDELRHNYQIVSATTGERSIAAADALGAKALLRRVQGRFAEAERISGIALEITGVCCGEDHPQLTNHLLRHAMICQQHGDFDTARRNLDHALELAASQKRRANSVPGILLLIRGILELELEQLNEAADALLEAWRISESVYGRGHRMTMDPIMILADVRLEQHEIAEAAQLAGEAMSICDRHGESFPIDRIDLLNVVSRVRMAQGDLSTAEQSVMEAGNLVDQHLDHEHYVHAEVLENLARLRRQQSRLDEAEEILGTALRIQERVRLTGHPAIARLLEDRARVLADMERYSEAAELRSRATKIRAAFADDA